jgi:hypothetical protein
MKHFRTAALLFLLTLACGPSVSAGELAILSATTWDEFVPKGKEVDAIYGDFVLRNDKIVVVIANPVAGRNANMTVRDVGGSIIDLTVRDQQSDQLSAYYPGARRFPYRLARISADGNIGLDVPGSTNKNHIAFEATNGRLDTRAQVLKGDVVRLELAAPAEADRPEVRLTYTLREGAQSVEIHSAFANTTDKPMKIVTVDDFRADRTFETAKAGETDLAWFYDKWWGQAYGVVSPSHKMRLTGSPAQPRAIEFLTGSEPSTELAAGKKLEVVRHLFAGDNLVNVRTAHARLPDPKTQVARHVVEVASPRGFVVGADVELSADGELFGSGRTNERGVVRFDLPAGKTKYAVGITAVGHQPAPKAIGWSTEAASGNTEIRHTVRLDAPARVIADISDSKGGPIPCKVQFIGVGETKSPFFFPDTGEHAVHNLCYSHNGRFAQAIAPGKYQVLISYGPEYDVEKLEIEAKSGQDTPIKATLRRVVQSPGWVSTDYHSHSSPSGDNVSSQRGRVLNLLCEHIEFAPCTEHNRLDTYAPHLQALGVAHLMGTCTGIELTGQPGTINHQNAFPLLLKPRTQDGGGPLTDADPAEQIKRLALWDDKSEKLVQTNHPDMGEMFFDRDGDGKPDGGFIGMFAYQDVIEVHPHERILDSDPYRTYADAKAKKTMQYNHTIFNWLQLLNQGRRLPGVVNTDAHYNHHGSGYIRNYVKCATDDPAKIDPMDMVHASEKGHIILTNGPYLEVTLHEGASASGAAPANPRRAIAGDDIALPGGFATLHVRVQCPNWFDIDRVQVLLNGRKDEKLNWTRSAHAEAFAGDVVKFDRKIPIEFKTDTHVIVVAVGENSTLGDVFGPDHAKTRPAAVSNPIFVDADGGGFKANGDTLGAPLPVKGGRTIDAASK